MHVTHKTQVAANVFGLSQTVIDCTEHTTLEDFAHSILTAESNVPLSNPPIRSRQDSYFLSHPTFTSIKRSPTSETFTEHKTIANVIIAKNLDEAPKQIQIQALELMRTKRIFTRTSVQTVPKRFLFIAVIAGGEGPRLTKHLNDYMFISHFHDPEDGLPNIEELYDDDGKSISSVVKRNPQDFADFQEPVILATVCQPTFYILVQTYMSTRKWSIYHNSANMPQSVWRSSDTNRTS